MNTIRIAVIMAGGSGERFWPLSRWDRPKQLLRLSGSHQSLLAEAVDRIAPAVGSEHVFIATGRHLAESIRQAKLGIPDENIIAEPLKRNTVGCLAYVAAVIGARFSATGQEVSMAVLTADHQIADGDRFRATVTTALAAAEQNDALVTIGIRPTRAETGYGYIEYDTQAEAAPGSSDECRILPALRFLEKPDRESAQRFLATGRYLWNSGMFFWRRSTFMQEMAKAQPEIARITENMTEVLRQGDDKTADELFAELPNISIDYALMERAAQVLVAPADFLWDDLGAWDALDRTFEPDAEGNIEVGDPILIDCRNSIVYNEPGAEQTAVAVVGASDLVVVVSKDAVLVVPKKRAQDVKAAVQALKERKASQL